MKSVAKINKSRQILLDDSKDLFTSIGQSKAIYGTLCNLSQSTICKIKIKTHISISEYGETFCATKVRFHKVSG